VLMQSFYFNIRRGELPFPEETPGRTTEGSTHASGKVPLRVNLTQIASHN
jgi:hypothetical protein